MSDAPDQVDALDDPQGALAHAESLKASGKQADNLDEHGHRRVGYVRTYDEARLRTLRIHLQDYLFDKGHTITKPMIDDLSYFVYDLEEAHYAQGKMTVSTAASTKPLADDKSSKNASSEELEKQREA